MIKWPRTSGNLHPAIPEHTVSTACMSPVHIGYDYSIIPWWSPLLVLIPPFPSVHKVDQSYYIICWAMTLMIHRSTLCILDCIWPCSYCIVQTLTCVLSKLVLLVTSLSSDLFFISEGWRLESSVSSLIGGTQMLMRKVDQPRTITRIWNETQVNILAC